MEHTLYNRCNFDIYLQAFVTHQLPLSICIQPRLYSPSSRAKLNLIFTDTIVDRKSIISIARLSPCQDKRAAFNVHTDYLAAVTGAPSEKLSLIKEPCSLRDLIEHLNDILVKGESISGSKVNSLPVEASHSICLPTSR